MPRFSKREGHRSDPHEIISRESAPEALRVTIVGFPITDLEIPPRTLRDVICGELRTFPDKGNWSASNIQDENQELISSAEWHRVYDVAEAIYSWLLAEHRDLQRDFEEEINEVLYEEGIGWEMTNGRFISRGDQVFQEVFVSSSKRIASSGLNVSSKEIQEALKDISRRPEPDLSGAMHHALAALESIAREVTGDEKATLGEVIKKHPNLFPKPLDEAFAKIWGYSSENARHGREGRTLERDDVELVVGLVAVMGDHLSRRLKS